MAKETQSKRITAQLDGVNAKLKSWVYRNIDTVSKALPFNETIYCLVEGSSDDYGNCALIATNEQLIFVSGNKITYMPYEQIIRLDTKKA